MMSLLSRKLVRFQTILLLLYIVALMVSMAAMEIISWTLFATVLAVVVMRTSDVKFPSYSYFTMPFLLLFWCWFGAIAKGMNSDQIFYAFAEFRWILLLFSTIIALQLAIKSGFLSQGFMEKYLVFFCILLALISVYGIVQYFTGLDFIRGASREMSPAIKVNEQVIRWRSSGFFSMPLTFAYSMGMVLNLLFPFLLVFSLLQKKKLFYFLLALTFAAGSVSVILSYARGAWIAFLGSIFISVFLLLDWRKRLISLAALAGAIVCVYLSSNFVQARIESIFDMSHRSNSERLSIWKANLLMFQENPWTGVGFNSQGFRVEEYLTKIGTSVEYPGHAHNNFLQFLSSTGFIGFLLYSIMVFYFMWLSLRSFRRHQDNVYLKSFAVALFSSQVMFHVGGLSECNFFDSEVRQLLVFIWALVIFFDQWPEWMPKYSQSRN